MFKIFIEVLIYLLAAYGLMYLVAGVIDSIRQRHSSESSSAKMVLIVKNQEHVIEGIIRNISSGDVLRKVMSNENLTVVDMSSSDRTKDILLRLKKDYLFFDVIGEEEKESIFKLFEGNNSNVSEPKENEIPL